MRRKQLYALFLCSLAPRTIGAGLLPLLPVHAGRLGAEPALVGAYLAFSFLALTVGTLVAGWLSDRTQRRKALLILSGIILVPALWLMGQATNTGQLTLLTAIVWFLGGMELTLISILAGLFAAETERGRVFGLLALTAALGGLIGGLTAGPIAERLGYPALFGVLALFGGLLPLTGLALEDKPAAPRSEIATTQKRAPLGAGFYLLLLASTVAGIAFYVGTLGTSLAMDQRGFLAGAISSTAAVSGLVTLPLTPLLGWLSDRMSRKLLLALCYLAGAIGLWWLATSGVLWHFWAVSSLLSILFYGGMTVGTALATDLVPGESLGKGISTFSTTTWIGGVVGFGLGGTAIQTFGMNTTLIAGALALLVAMILLIPMRRTAQEVQPV
jgi:MFS family permease